MPRRIGEDLTQKGPPKWGLERGCPCKIRPARASEVGLQDVGTPSPVVGSCTKERAGQRRKERTPGGELGMPCPGALGFTQQVVLTEHTGHR